MNFKPNTYFYRQRVLHMPRLLNQEPYGDNEISHWFAQIYSCSPLQGQKHFDNARSLSNSSAKADPLKWPPFLIFDKQTNQWHGSSVP
jgi:hypothetical protein